MNIKQESQNQNINLGQPEEFSVYEQVEDTEGTHIACSKKKRIKITPMYTIHKTRHDSVLYKVELQKYKPMKIGDYELGDFKSVTDEVFNVSGEEMQKFMNYLAETFALEKADIKLIFNADNIKSVLIIGKIPQSVVEQATFESFRNELKGVEIITFDELLEKIELQIKIIEGTGF